MQLAALLSLLLLPAARASAAEGDLDPSFAGGGRTTTDLGGGDYGNSVAIDGQGRIVVAGDSQSGSGADIDLDWVLARYNPDGSLDPSFGSGGIAVTPIPGTYEFGSALAIDGQGRIVLAGARRDGASIDFAVTRFLPNGNLDPSFGTGGIVTTPVGSDWDFGFAVGIDAQGRILVGGASEGPGGDDFALARYEADGDLDGSFGTGGTRTTSFGVDDYADALAIDTAGRIILGGESWNGSENQFAIARYDANGTLDPSFDGDGKQTTVFGAFSSEGQELGIDAEGRIVLVGSSNVDAAGDDSDFALARYNPDGSLDPSFGGDGRVTTPIAGDDQATGIGFDPQGRILVGGESKTATDWDFALARLNPDGSLDPTFATGGTQTTDFAAEDDRARSLAIDGQGRIVLAGRTKVGEDSTFGDVFDFAVARYVGDATAPALELGGKKKQPLGKAVKLAVACVEACAVEATGKLALKGGKDGSSRPAGRAGKLKLKPAGAELAAGETGVLKLKLKKKTRKLAAAALEAGARAKAKLAASASDAAGNVAEAKRKVRLKG